MTAANETVNKVFNLFVPLLKRDDDQHMVYGYASTDCKDSDGETIAVEAIKGALPDYMKFGNIREMHQLSAVGVAKEAELKDNGLYIGAKIVDKDAWEKVKEGVYKGFSIGGSALARKGATITELKLIEISLVDRPANPECLIEVFKAEMNAGDTKMTTVSPPATDTAVDSPQDQLVKIVLGLDKTAAEAALAAFQKRVIAKEEPKEVVPPEPEFDVDHFAIMLNKIDDTTLIKSPAQLAMLLGVSMDKMPIIIDRATELGKSDKDEDKSDSGKEPYGDVEYADPGHQKDGKKRYPIDSEEHIRAAWNYINKPKNAAKYSSADCASIKGRIAAAWKKKIDPDGPPSASEKAEFTVGKNTLTKAERSEVLSGLGKADATTSFKKGMYAASCALSLLGQLDYLHKQLEREAAIEEDDSPLPDRFKALLETMGTLVKALVDEEIEEMLNNKDAVDFDSCMPMLYAASPEVRKAAADILRKSIGDNTAAPGFQFLDDFADHLEKGGDGNDDWSGHSKGSEGDSNDRWKAHTDSAEKIHKAAQEIVEQAMSLKSLFKAGKDGMDDDCDDDNKKSKAKYNPKERGKPSEPPKNVKSKKEKANDGDEDDKEMPNGKKRKAAPQATDEHGEHDYDDDSDGDGDGHMDGKTGNGSEDHRANKAMNTEVDALATTVASLAKAVETLTSDMQATRRNPPAKGTLKAVTKGEDFVSSSNDDVSETQTPQDVLKGIFGNPNFITR